MRSWRLCAAVGIVVGLGSFAGPPGAQAFLGASAADLVYTPVAPCRIIDTRVAGAGGPIVPGVPRDFLVSGTVNFAAQGGTAGGCAVPEGATAAMLNLVAVNPSGAGDLRAWAFGQPVPGASIINYAAVAGLNIANGVAVPLCDPATAACTFDVSVQADVSGAQLVVDVLGYLQSTAPRGASSPFNTFLGADAGNFTMTGTVNTATGVRALFANTTGSSNTATGVQALFANTTGSSNTATGVEALFSNTFGFSNTATGYQALNTNTTGNNNTATGAFALQRNTTGFNNTATGVSALFFNTTGADNTATGINALVSNTTGNNNTAVGIGADVSIGNLTNATAIGANAIVNASNKIRLGNASVTVIEGQVAYTFPSDVNQKENFLPLDGDEVLRKLGGLRVTSWNYAGQDAAQFRHYGPNAQEFFAAFGRDGVGIIGSPTTINSGDEAGILMVALQALARRTAEIAELKARLEVLERLVRDPASLKASAESPAE